MEEWTAREDLKHRIWTVRAAIQRYAALQGAQVEIFRAITPESSGLTTDQVRISSQTDAALESILNAANHLRRALRSRHLPASIRGRTLDKLDAPIRHLRNIREHWDESRDFWSAGKAIPPGRKYASARWYKKHFPDQTPWSARWSMNEGSILGGIVSVDDLSTILDEVESALSQT